ncbi:hypothetical protein kac65v162_gp052 [Nodularia phage vB_NspS-kac65v162]|uniref:Uncharacterized protein n=3 Tax=Ravarandavirus kac65v151 TaxID=2845689 RepID=A0A482MJC2_9CAUD|nr:hypothetical protein HWC12_gp052 [Nodularia phage vB_NspS-kac65v151]QBQ73084.1 hypothetical protein kac65v151_gp052 [Nodularia phage vB_NspS-kac65v151]QBQ73290.1 hypothetical protein kac65v161_gp052 [Nodularia phage vB_NspS-kac65v161]QBQ73496.1 hypothetical protein kac65v162_gp052 [Nodularia phage vB_NspS-kac65v162]
MIAHFLALTLLLFKLLRYPLLTKLRVYQKGTNPGYLSGSPKVMLGFESCSLITTPVRKVKSAFIRLASVHARLYVAGIRHLYIYISIEF